MLFTLRKIADRAFSKAAPIIETKARLVLARTISESPVIDSLLNGKLMVDFGLTSEIARSATNQIIAQISKDVTVKLQPAKDKNTIGSLIFIVPPISSALAASISDGRYISQGQYGGGEVTWLEWLLTKGTTVILDDFEVVQTVDYDDRSRSGGGFTIKTGVGFRIEPPFAGIEGDNFLTRAIALATNEIQAIIKKELIGAL